MVEYHVEFEGVNNYSGFYNAIKKGLDLPEWCGENPDAIWDMLTGYMEYPAIITLHGLDTLPKELDEEKELLLTILKRTVIRHPYLKYEIKIVDKRRSF